MEIKYFDEENEIIEMGHSCTNLFDFFEKQGYFFSPEILTRYFLSLKTKPFVILTGISGTGKTKIAQVFADYICQDEVSQKEKEKRVVFVSVRPDWMDNKGLLGYYNVLKESYSTTPVLRLLLEAGKNPKKPYFIILDEMNLAKVEYYFADILSTMESRTPSRPLGEPLNLYDPNDRMPHLDTPIPDRLHIPPNVYFTGTVNVDESTYMFSPKVLDRANVIEFNEVDLSNYGLSMSSRPRNHGFTLKDGDVRNRLLVTGESHFCSYQDYNKIIGLLSSEHPIPALLLLLKKYHLHFGYRVANEIGKFTWNASELVIGFNLNDTIDIQILQKILPKLHGTKAKLEEPLWKVLAFCYEIDEPISEETRVKAENFDNQARFPRSAQKVARMLRNLQQQGYISFIE